MKQINLNSLKLYNLVEISKATGISLSTLRNAIKTNELRARKLGREYKCTMTEILRFIQVTDAEIPEVAQ
ncbi:MAG: hypothetical protein A2268_01635 [Candidatus Raymondbacteria bacterium RifOxyA12_full_50_37]|uniref:Helix-turn-helix domain-containing protein n=1 Tax=Candidatus Raymondbacteria bacterium RIFOXYD12_FULL_49_13 TaxID=1817890 RepID=A0A1F7FA85_UNCRA|nr:MAG: hypothetical protein A2268_01635 [Candidatus Raymondbacteria bacterium RifOxyA12_full_50_37]OGJ87767.1 MAG: hypothetical protein A2248_07240 [Candidatus Raymondbacteria bacterium RIFOXYA2_FULL_49_16]OGJ95645.1 MAG: hypothetical protein A2453_13235 [Candidatus Raymondbacteria bacterium RIFOXYC2_FULL_50_21]OGJ99680.1 MAG: hypothetical protein A2487_11190 [Candidatus Raymondbacteria bacterium RifOxyC12_full_50_8]OGK03416.1 MAG: hypothetical protein A2519_15515 [Candidatus Raymondbacteria b